MPVDPKFIVTRSGKEFVLYAGLLALAHEQGLDSIETKLLEYPAEHNVYTAIVHCRVIMTNGNKFDGIGDANIKSVPQMIQQHIIRMAETRAKSRVLRDATNIGITAFEECNFDEERHEAQQAAHPTASKVQSGSGNGETQKVTHDSKTGSDRYGTNGRPMPQERAPIASGDTESQDTPQPRPIIYQGDEPASPVILEQIPMTEAEEQNLKLAINNAVRAIESMGINYSSYSPDMKRSYLVQLNGMMQPGDKTKTPQFWNNIANWLNAVQTAKPNHTMGAAEIADEAIRIFGPTAKVVDWQLTHWSTFNQKLRQEFNKTAPKAATTGRR